MKTYRLGNQVFNIPDVEKINVVNLETETDRCYPERIEWYLAIYTDEGRFSVFLGYDRRVAHELFEKIVEETFSKIEALAR